MRDYDVWERLDIMCFGSKDKKLYDHSDSMIRIGFSVREDGWNYRKLRRFRQSLL